MTGLYYYKLVSEYPEDITKNCKLTINEIDSNFKVLKDYDIKTAEFVRGEDCTKSDGTLVITRNNGDKVIVPIDTTICKNLTYDYNVSTAETKSGATLTISYKDDEGIVKKVTLENVITADNLIDVIGSDVLTKVITDNSLKGLGTMSSPLGLAGIEKTGMLAPAIKVMDLTDGSKLPEVAKEGTRYVTREYVSDYGYLYNGEGVKKISDLLDQIYEREEIYKEVDDRKYYWRIPSKADWDKMLNSIEPCEFRNHNSAQCHKELGKYAGKFLKSECGWTWQEPCDCVGKKHYEGCDYPGATSEDGEYLDWDEINPNPNEKEIDPRGVDKYGMAILPAGIDFWDKSYKRPETTGFGKKAAFWTTSHIYDDESQDIYIKIFQDDMAGVYQVAECPDPYYSVRLVKDYDGSNYREVEYIDGVAYKAVLFPESGQIWLASNVANTNGMVGYTAGMSEAPDYLKPNNGDGISDQRIEMFINEYNGRYWEKKVMNEGDTIVIQNPCFDGASATTANVCWKDSEDIEHCVEIVIPKVYQSNIEYRVYLEDCDKVLKNTDDLVIERVLAILTPMLEQERFERIEEDAKLWDALSAETDARIAADEVLSGAIDTLREDLDNEIERAISAETELWTALEEEISARTAADEVLSGAIDTEREERISADTMLNEKIDAEIERAIAREDEIEEELLEEIDRAKAREDEIDGQLIDWEKVPFTMTAGILDGNNNLVLETKDENPDHFIKINFDGNFGEI